MSEWIKSGRSSGHAQTFLKLKVYKAEKNPRGGVLDPVSHPKGQGEIKMCTGPVSARSVFWLAVVFTFSSSSLQVCVGGGGR